MTELEYLVALAIRRASAQAAGIPEGKEDLLGEVEDWAPEARAAIAVVLSPEARGLE